MAGMSLTEYASPFNQRAWPTLLPSLQFDLTISQSYGKQFSVAPVCNFYGKKITKCPFNNTTLATRKSRVCCFISKKEIHNMSNNCKNEKAISYSTAKGLSRLAMKILPHPGPLLEPLLTFNPEHTCHIYMSFIEPCSFHIWFHSTLKKKLDTTPN